MNYSLLLDQIPMQQYAEKLRQREELKELTVKAPAALKSASTSRFRFRMRQAPVDDDDEDYEEGL